MNKKTWPYMLNKLCSKYNYKWGFYNFVQMIFYTKP